MKILGVYFCYNVRLKQELNFDAIKKTLNNWQWRNLTIWGKIQIIKTFAMPKFMYRASLLNFDKTFMKTVNSIMFNFVWNGKDKIKRLALIGDYKDGGLKMPHIESAVKAQRIICVKKFLEDYSSPWKSILSYQLRDHGDKFLLHCNYNSTDLPKCLPNFYNECFKAWADLLSSEICSYEDVGNQILWNNQYLRIDNKPQFRKDLIEKGIVQIKDIIFPNDDLKPWNFFEAKGLSFIGIFFTVWPFSGCNPGVLDIPVKIKIRNQCYS